MRHRVYGKKLSRNKNERAGLFKSLVSSLFIHGSITTSEAKVKAIKGMVDKIITLAKEKNSQRFLSTYFTKDLQERLVKEILPKLATRTSGYTSLVRMKVQPGDNTTVVKMSLIGAESLKPLEKVIAKKIEKVETKKVVVKKPVARKKVTIKK